MGVIAGIAILGYDSYTKKSREQAYRQSINSLEIAVDFYIQNNRSKLPKEHGEKIELPIKQLKKLNYIKNDIYNEKNENCMDKSYVTITRIDNRFTYSIQMICANSKQKIIVDCENKEYNLDK